MTSTIIDTATTLAIYLMSEKETVSLDLHVSFLSKISAEERLWVLSEVHKVGGSVASTSAKLYKEIGGGLEVVAIGNHSKAIIKDKK